jgi:selenocysteine lyase/cysteine desulfurase
METTGRDDGWVAQRDAFDVPDDVAYFNTASLAPMLHTVRAAGEAALRRRSAPWTIRAPDWFTDVEQLRSLAGRLVGSDDGDGVALIPATSYGFAVAARNLPLAAGRRILVLADEYPSGIYTWQAAVRRTGADLLTVTRQPGQSWTDAVLAVLDDRVAIVSVPNVHWTDGALIDLDAVAARTHQIGAGLVIDASQSLGALPFDVTALRPDFLISVGYKWLLGPFGRGYLWVADHHRAGEPLEQNWIVRAGADNFARLVDYRDDYQPGARRFDQGARTLFELTPMAIAALEQLLRWGVATIGATLATITSRIRDRAAALGLTTTTDLRGPHILGLRLPPTTGSRLLPALAEANCFAALRGDALRISPHLHTTEADVERLTTALTTAL